MEVDVQPAWGQFLGFWKGVVSLLSFSCLLLSLGKQSPLGMNEVQHRQCQTCTGSNLTVAFLLQQWPVSFAPTVATSFYLLMTSHPGDFGVWMGEFASIKSIPTFCLGTALN